MRPYIVFISLSSLLLKNCCCCCRCVCGCRHFCGGRSTACGSQSSPSITHTLRTEFRLLGFGSKNLCLLRHLVSLIYNLSKRQIKLQGLGMSSEWATELQRSKWLLTASVKIRLVLRKRNWNGAWLSGGSAAQFEEGTHLMCSGEWNQGQVLRELTSHLAFLLL